MKLRKDGEITRLSILDAACKVFGEKGYHKTTHAEISRIAGVNSALINFHFGSKDNLYKAVWERISREIEELYPIYGGVSPDAAPDERLRGFIGSLLNRALDTRLEGFHRILTTESVNLTGIIDKEIAHHFQLHRTYTIKLITELLGPLADEKDIELCEMSIISQCHNILPRPFRKCKRKFKHSDAERLTEHITAFSLAGVAAIRQRIEADAK